MSAPATLVFEKDVAIEMNDGNLLRANVFRPRAYGDAHSRYPVILAHGVYGKDIHFADGYKPQTREVDENRAGRRQGFVVGDRMPVVGDDPALSKQRHGARP